jgi:hypothetical protein
MKDASLLVAFFAVSACAGSTTTAATEAEAGTGGTDGSTAADVVQGDAFVDAGACQDCLSAAITWGQTGGLVPFVDSSSLASCRTYARARSGRTLDGGTPSCSAQIGSCSEPPVGVADVERALVHPDVVAALASPTPPVYGMDSRPVDGSLLAVTIDGKEIDVGAECPPDGRFCRVAVPAGVRALADVLERLDAQEIATPACAVFQR